MSYKKIKFIRDNGIFDENDLYLRGASILVNNRYRLDEDRLQECVIGYYTDIEKYKVGNEYAYRNKCSKSRVQNYIDKIESVDKHFKRNCTDIENSIEHSYKQCMGWKLILEDLQITEVEKQILTMMVEDYTQKEIADKLDIAFITTRRMIKKIRDIIIRYFLQ